MTGDLVVSLARRLKILAEVNLQRHCVMFRSHAAHCPPRAHTFVEENPMHNGYKMLSTNSLNVYTGCYA